MCLIIVKPVGVDLPPDWHLKNGDDRNSDGIGIMYWKKDENEVHIKKDFDNVTELITFIKANIIKEDVLVVHFRIATSGLKDKGNRHPFPVTINKKLLRDTELICQMGVAHNGILSEYSGHKTYSDTQKFIVDILSDPSIKDNLENPAISKLINNFLGGDKLTILDNRGTLHLFGEYEIDGERGYSNTSFKYGKFSDYNNYNLAWYRKNGYDSEDWDKDKEKDKQSYLPLKEDTGSMNMCDGCLSRKYVKSIEYKNQTRSLCKKCRKKLKKGQLTHLISDEEILIESKCDNCGCPTPEKELKEKKTFNLCKECFPKIDEADL